MSNADTQVQSLEPFFVIGSPRSGTTLLRLILTSHPQIVVPPECGFVTWLYPTFGNWGLSEFSIPENITRFAAAVIASRKFETWGISETQLVEAIKESYPQGYSYACETVYRLYCKHAGKPLGIWGDKNNYYLSQIGILSAIFPKARFIHIVRDGRDVACSYREVMSLETDSPYRPALPVKIEEIAKRWSTDIQTIRRSFHTLLPDKKYELRYEDLVMEPHESLAHLCSWLGVSFFREMLKFNEANRKHRLEPTVTMDWKRRTLDPVNTSVIGRFKNELSEVDIDAFKDIASSELIFYKYIKSSNTK